MKKVVLALIVGAFLLLTVPSGTKVQADIGVAFCGGDGIKACLSTTSPFVKEQLIKQGYFTWCVDARAANYPDFRNQLREVMNTYGDELGIPNWEVPYSKDGSCHIRNDMPDNHQCNGCAAWIYTGNLPMLIEYKWQLGYTYWLSTDGHEVGHGVCLADEHYDKVNFRSFILTYGYWQHGAPTVMDSGTPLLAAYTPKGIYWPTAYDVELCKDTLAPHGVKSFYGMWYEPNGKVFGYFCGSADPRATRVAIMAVAPDGTPYWSGIHMQPSSGCQSFEILPGDGWCFDVNVENAFSWRKFRNDVRLGCT